MIARDVLDAGIAEATARWPGIADRALAEPFAEAIRARIEGEDDEHDAVAKLALPDIYLVTAVLAKQRAAIAAFEKLVRDETTRAVARLGKHAPAAEDVVQELLVKLLVPHAGTAKLAAYGGHGALHAWLRVAAVRTAISLTRRKQENRERHPVPAQEQERDPAPDRERQVELGRRLHPLRVDEAPAAEAAQRSRTPQHDVTLCRQRVAVQGSHPHRARVPPRIGREAREASQVDGGAAEVDVSAERATRDLRVAAQPPPRRREERALHVPRIHL
jgi:DNA-directed RNA polymerase specialized sigma24 family protein